MSEHAKELPDSPRSMTVMLNNRDEVLFVTGNTVYHLDAIDPLDVPERDRVVAWALTQHIATRLLEPDTAEKVGRLRRILDSESLTRILDEGSASLSDTEVLAHLVDTLHRIREIVETPPPRSRS